ncbi:MAG: lipid-binding SYLF domain-containing protein [Janthinobacterium lividum]
MTLRLAPTLVAAALAATALASTPAMAQRRPSPDSETARGPQKLVDKAVSVVGEMDRDPKLHALLRRAAGIYIIPEYGQAGFLIGGRGGAGVAAARTGRGWSAPAFFSFGGLNIGLQAGGAGGSVVYLLMNRHAVSQFVDRTKVSLNANAGYAIVKYSDADQANLAKGDVIMWTNTKGAYAGATIEASGIHADTGRTREFYGRDVSPRSILNGQVTAPGARYLQGALAR